MNDRLVHAYQNVVNVVNHLGRVGFMIADERKLVHLRARLIGRVRLCAHLRDRSFKPLLPDRQIIRTRVDVINNIGHVPDEWTHRKELFRHAVGNRVEISTGGLQPEPDSMLFQLEPLRPGERYVELFGRVRRHDGEV